MRLALLQVNPVVGDIAHNIAVLADQYSAAVDDGADLVAAGELAVTGYPPQDLVLKSGFVQASTDAVQQLATHTDERPLIVGFVEQLSEQIPSDWRPADGVPSDGPPLANAAALLRHGRVEAVYRKHRLPNYGVFDEERYFRQGTEPLTVVVAGRKVGITICEDLWGSGGPVQEAVAAGAELVLNLNASPYSAGIRDARERWASHHAGAAGVPLAYVNLVGGQDEVVFDGDSFAVNAAGTVVARGAQFAQDRVMVDLGGDGTLTQAAGDAHERLPAAAEIYQALVLGTADYVNKNGFGKVALGVSGGIDSALVAAIATDAVGPDRVTGIGMPSMFTAEQSMVDARALVKNLGIEYVELPITEPYRGFEDVLAEPFTDAEVDVAEENIQARIRGVLLMAWSNKFGHLVLVTSNKSEGAVGYTTLYGDMAGGFAPIKDVLKTQVYELSGHVNAEAGWHRIPESSITKAPSAELRPGQRDTDSLPAYEVLDPILSGYIERDRSVSQITEQGFDREVVQRIARLVDSAEHKRRQAAPGVKISGRAFGGDRRLPITQRWSNQLSLPRSTA